MPATANGRKRKIAVSPNKTFKWLLLEKAAVRQQKEIGVEPNFHQIASLCANRRNYTGAAIAI